MVDFTVTRENEYADRTRNFQVLVNGQVVGEIGNDESRSFSTENQEFVLSLKLGRKASPSLSVISNEESGVLRFRCGSNLARVSPYLLALTSLFRPRNYLWLKKV